jgi:sarcosine oxidase subunit beta
MSTGTDVIVVGGGLVGAAAAFFLRRRKRSVVLLERNLIGQQASGTNFGNLRRQGRFLGQMPLANRSREIWGKLRELIGDDCEFIPSGHIRVCYTQEQAAKLEIYARDARDYGLDLEMISSNSLREKFPYIGRQVVAGSLSRDDGHANPRLSAPAFGRAAHLEGAQIVESAEVLSIEKVGDDFRVETRKQGIFRAPVVLIAAGAWGGAMSARFGEPVPLSAHGPQMAVTEPVPYRIKTVIGVSSPLENEIIYLRQVTRGNIVFGGGARGLALVDEVRAYVDPQNTLAQFDQLRRLLPGLAALTIIRVWSGVESYLPDDLPIMGKSSRVSGLYYAFGFCGHGFQTGPGVGETMAELISTGSASIPIEPYDISRFANHQISGDQRKVVSIGAHKDSHPRMYRKVDFSVA